MRHFLGTFVLGSLLAPSAWADYRFTLGEFEGQASFAAGAASLVTIVAVAAVGVVAGLLLDRLLDFDDALDAGGEWDEGGGVYTRWM